MRTETCPACLGAGIVRIVVPAMSVMSDGNVTELDARLVNDNCAYCQGNGFVMVEPIIPASSRTTSGPIIIGRFM